MMSGKCKKLCPVSFGLAVGLACGLGYLIWVFWVMYYGPSAMMVASSMPVPDIQGGLVHSCWVFLKGFVFGFFVALFYDWISCCCKSKWCCKKSDGSCCSCSSCSCSSGSKPEAGK